MRPNNNTITASTFIHMNQWSERMFNRAIYALREYNREQTSIAGLRPAGEMLDFEWRLPCFDVQENKWVDIEPDERGVTVVLTWLLT